jgi:KDO2-lipid IV(A) lauroyltransferase
MKSPWSLLWQPKNWLFGIILIPLRLIVFLPYRRQMQFGKKLGNVLCCIYHKKRQNAAVNLALCFPNLSKAQRHTLLKKCYESVGMGFIETALAWFGQSQQIPPLTIHGLEHWQACHTANQPILLLSAHFTCLELAGRLVAQHLPLKIVYSPQKIKLFDHFVQYYRQKFYTDTISRHNLRKVIRCLKAGDTIWYTPDIDAGLVNSVFAPFFGNPAATITTTARLAQATGAACLPCFFYRKKDLSGYELFLGAPLADYPSGDDLKDATQMNQLIEQAILKAPEQYLWQYKRFKTRPDDGPSLYE